MLLLCFYQNTSENKSLMSYVGSKLFLIYVFETAIFHRQQNQTKFLEKRQTLKLVYKTKVVKWNFENKILTSNLYYLWNFILSINSRKAQLFRLGYKKTTPQ